jgi:large conductance mechanosensitive channel
MWKEFKEFAFKGNVIDLAVGIVIGAAFGAIVKSLVDSFINPLVGLVVGKTDLANLFVAIPAGNYKTAAGAQAQGAIVFTYGSFLNAALSFLLIALVLFLVVKAVNRFRTTEETTKPCPYCASDIPMAATRCPECTSQLGGDSVRGAAVT